MKTKRSLLTIVAVLFLAVCCAFFAVNLSQKNQAFADVPVTAPTESDTVYDVTSDEFVLLDGASIRLSGNAMKFTATVSESIHSRFTNSSLDVLYFATMNVVGSDVVVAQRFGAQPDFRSGDVYTLNAYLNFETANEEVLAQALNSDFEIAVYARVTTSDGVTFYKAKNSNEVERNMRAVANSAYLNWQEGDGYAKEDILEFGYFTDAFRSEDEYAVLATNKTLYVNIPNAPEEISAIYVDGKKVETTDYEIADFAIEGNYVSVIDANGKVYSTNIGTGYTAIADKAEFTSAFAVARYVEGKYAIVNDIDIGSWTNPGNGLAGTINGLGHTLTGNANGTYTGIFGNAKGAIVKNWTIVHNGSWSNNGAFLFGIVDFGTAGNVNTNYLKNVVMYAPTTGYNSSLLVAVLRRNNVFEVENTLFIVDKIGHSTLNGIVCNINDGPNGSDPAGRIDFINSAFTQGGDANRKASSGYSYNTGVKAYLDSVALYNGVAAGEITAPGGTFEMLDDLGALVLLNNENITRLQTATTGTWVLTEDIDMWQYTNTASTSKWNPSATFTGVFNGNGYSFINIGGTSNTYYNGIFYKLTGATIKNAGFEFYGNLTRAAITGQIIGSAQTVIENVAVRVDAMHGQSASAIAGVVQNNYLIKDSIIAVGHLSSSAGGKYGILSGGEATNGKPAVSNVVILNREPARVSITNTSSSALAEYYATKTDLATKAENGVDYFEYETGEDLYNAMIDEEFKLPASVIELARDIDILHEINSKNVADLKKAYGCGYWYVTEDIDFSSVGGWYYSSNSLKDAYYHSYTNIELDGMGHKLTNINLGSETNDGLFSQGAGGTIKNAYFEFLGGAGGTYSGYFFGISRSYMDDSFKEVYNFENLFIDIKVFSNWKGGLFVGFCDAAAEVNVTNVYVNIQKGNSDASGVPLFFGWNMNSDSIATFTSVYVVGPAITVNEMLSLNGVTMKNSEGATLDVNDTYDLWLVNSTDVLFAEGEIDYIVEDLGGLYNLNKTYFDGILEHTHNAGEWEIIKQPTCKENGTKVKKCTICGKVVETETIPSTGHNEGEWEVITNADCINNGTKVKKCTVCGDVVETEVIPTTGIHTEGEWEIVQQPTCKENGEKVKKCTVCGDVVETEVILATGEHVAGDWEVETPATSSTPGTLVRKCGCGEVLERKEYTLNPSVDFDADDFFYDEHEHVAGDWEIVEEANCGKDGLRAQRCTECGKILNKETIEKNGEHQPSDWIIDLYGTCYKQGHRHKECTICKRIVAEEDYYDSHFVGKWEIEKEPTCDSEGLKVGFCSICGEGEFEEIIPALEHTEGDWEISVPSCLTDGEQVKKCTVCGKVVKTEIIPATGHTEGEWEIITDADCENNGSKVIKCTVCGDVVMTEVIPATGHTEGEWEISVPSCLTDGEQVKKCTVCGKVVKTETIPASGHTEGEWENSIPVGCVENGLDVKKCTVCGEILETRDVQATGEHIAGSEWEIEIPATASQVGTKVRKCTVCGEVVERVEYELDLDVDFDADDFFYDEHEHVAGDWEIVEEANCGKDGLRGQRCTECGKILNKEIIEKSGEHAESDWIIDVYASCVIEGHRHKVCAICNRIVAEEDYYIDHIAGEWKIVSNAACENDGLKVSECAICKTELEEVIPATGHTEGDWEVETSATCFDTGLKVKKCNSCGEVLESEIIPALDVHGNVLQEVTVSEPTCTAEGKVDLVCDFCGHKVDERIIPATGHTEGEWETETPATCVTAGLEVKKCTVCGEILETREIATNGSHAGGEWEITISASCATTGTKVKKCLGCGEIAETETIPANGEHLAGNWEYEGNTATKSCVVCGTVMATDTVANATASTPIALTADNITTLLTATSGYYYLTEDIDMSAVCANGGWASSTKFTGTLDGRGYTLYNFTPGNGGHQGLFYKLSNGAVIKDLAVRITNCGQRVGFIGQAVDGAESKILIERVALYYEDMSFADYKNNVSYCASGFVHVPQADVLLKDCFAYIAQSGTIYSTYTGYLFGGEADTINPRVENVYVMSVGNYMQAPIGTSGSVDVIITNKNYVPAVLGEDYFHYSSAAALNQAFANGEIKLPASVVEQMKNLGVFATHNHVASDWIMVEAPTCQFTGKEAKLCLTCGMTMEQRAVAKVAHAMEEEWSVGEVANCVSTGTLIKECEVCGEDVSTKVVAKDLNTHVNFEWIMNANGQMEKHCHDCNKVVERHSATAKDYVNTETETFSIWAYGATPGKWISWVENGATVKYFLFETGNGGVQYIKTTEMQYYYYNESGKLVRSDVAVDNCITEADAVNMTSTAENGTLDVYKEANFNTLFYTFGADMDYDNVEGTLIEEIFHWAEVNGLKVFTQGGTFHHMASQKTPLIDAVNGITYTDGIYVSTTTKFKTQADLNKFVIYYLRNVIDYPAFKGVTFIDEPTWESFVAMGQLAQGVVAASEYYGKEIYVMENLLPYAHSEAHWKIYNGIGLTGYEAYEYYLNTYYENVGKYLGYVQYDDYPLRVEGYGQHKTDWWYEEIIPYFIRTHQFTSEWAREKGIDRAMAVQSYGDAGNTGRRGCSPEDILWQMNIAAAFGVKDYTYYTYFPIINTAGGADNWGEEYVVDRDGIPTKTYAGVQQANAELLYKGKALMNFEYEDLHIYTAYDTTNIANRSDYYFFAGCGGSACQECAVKQGTLKYIESATVGFNKGAVLITELVDEESGVYGYYVVNIADPLDDIRGNVTINVSNLFNSAQVYHGTTVTNHALVNGQLTINLGVGDGAFIIPFNA